jgi:hypothetical protein
MQRLLHLLRQFGTRPVRAVAISAAVVTAVMILAVGGGADAQPTPAIGSSAPLVSGTPAPAAVSPAPPAAGAPSAAVVDAKAPVAVDHPNAPKGNTDPKIAALCAVKNKPKVLQPLWEKLVPIGVMLLIIALVLWRLPKVDLGHSPAFRRRRMLNWLPLGLTYSFLYMGRYNLKAFQGIDGGLTEAQYGVIFGVGSAVYGLSFLLNGPLTDRWGGRATIIISSAGSAVANLIMGAMVVFDIGGEHRVPLFAALYGLNMYFQSFGAVSIVKVNASWFHVSERGVFGAIFGVLISLGVYFAYDGGGTASGDFGGRKNAGIAVGIIDGFVYIGSTIQSFLYGATLPAAKVYCADGSARGNPAAKSMDAWYIWPIAMLPVALLGFVLALRLWNAKANKQSGGH